jgi:hypothetical protein
MATTDANVQEALAWEARHRRPAAVAAAIGGIATLAGALYATSAYNDQPSIGELQALTPALQGQVEPAVNPRTEVAQFLADNLGSLLLVGIISAIGTLGAGYALYFLFRATTARRKEVPGFARWLVVIGSVLVSITLVVQPILRSLRAQDYIDSADRSRHAIDSALAGGPLIVVTGFGVAGALAFALAFVLVCINAMRAGLLTRFMGVLGIIVGVLYVIPLGNLPVVPAFWLIALVPLFLGRWPNGTPKAWESGQAEPWPSAAQVREQRMREATRKQGSDDRVLDDAVDAGAEPAPAPKPSAARKRRKRR